MQLVLTVISVGTLFYLVFLIIEFSIGFNFIKKLSTQNTLRIDSLPAISIIFSARNEEQILQKSIKSMLNMNYPQFEIIAINDRSTDNTQAILDQFEYHPLFKSKRIDCLPKSWLGKNHALHVASQSAQGEWLLFTDADVLMKPDLLSKSISYAIQNNLDHLTIYENHIKNGFWLKILYLASYITYSMAFKPWRIKYFWSKKSLGHGAFNLIKKSCYLKCGGHQAIAMECLDDLKLGELIKSKGYKQDTVDGKFYIEREWYSSLGEMINGLRKNSFAYFNYSFMAFFINFFLGMLFFISPVFIALLSSGKLQFLAYINILLTLWMAVIVAKHFQLQKLFVFFYPLGILMLFYTVWNSVVATYRHQGIIWRDTHYSLKELRNKR